MASTLISAIDKLSTGMQAQSLRLNTVVSNLANADTIASKPEDAYHAKKPVFKTLMEDMGGLKKEVAGVKVSEILLSEEPIRKSYDPQNPLADKNGFIYHSNVNKLHAMTDLRAASLSMQMNITAFDTIKRLALRTLQIGQGG